MASVVSVPPGFRFHPTDEELLYYYLRKKVSYEVIDLDVIKEVDLNKLEPWDLKDKCRIGSGPQNEWYFFSHKDKKYPTGTRTNRATAAGFWKATGRDKTIHVGNSCKRIGMRKTLVFYTGRAPHGQKTDWIMHEYRLENQNPELHHDEDDGWVVCRVFKKKNHVNRGFQAPSIDQKHFINGTNNTSLIHNLQPQPPQQPHQQNPIYEFTSFDSSMHLPQLFSPDMMVGDQRQFNGDWSFLDKLLASNNNGMDPTKLCNPFGDDHHIVATTTTTTTSSSANRNKFPFQYLGCETLDILKFSK